MEVWSAISNLSPGVAIGVVCLYFFNLMAIRYLEERKEMIQSIMAERKEWADTLRAMNAQYVDLLRSAVEAMTKMAGDNYALRGKIQEFMTSLDTQMRAIAETLRAMQGRRTGDGND